MDTVSDDPSSTEPRTAYAWRDGDWLVLHEKKAVLPRRCMVCDAPAHKKPLRMSLWKRVTPMGCLFFGWFAFMFSQRSSTKVWLCADHRAREITYQCVFRSLLILGVLCLVVSFFGTFYCAGKNDELAESCSLLIPLLALPLFSVLAFFVVLRPRLVRVVKIDKPFVWLEQISPDYLARFPEVPQQQ